MFPNALDEDVHPIPNRRLNNHQNSRDRFQDNQDLQHPDSSNGGDGHGNRSPILQLSLDKNGAFVESIVANEQNGQVEDIPLSEDLILPYDHEKDGLILLSLVECSFYLVVHCGTKLVEYTLCLEVSSYTMMLVVHIPLTAETLYLKRNSSEVLSNHVLEVLAC